MRKKLSPQSCFFFITAPRPGPPADPSRNWSGPVTMDSPLGQSFTFSSLLVSRSSLLKIENPAVQFYVSQPIESRCVSKLTLFPRFIPPSRRRAMAGRDFSRRLLFRHFASISRLFDHYVAPLCRPLSPRQSKYPIWLADPKITFDSVISPSGIRWHIPYSYRSKKSRHFFKFSGNKCVYVLTIGI